VQILIVDDSSSVRDVIKSLLRNSVEQIIECDNGITAVKMYQQYKPDCVLMDIRMKGMDGLEATEKITRLDPEARVIVVTQYDYPNLREKAKRAGTVGFVLKENLIDIERIIQ
jgi:two-component system chemotaxis response regulator CheY